MGNRKGGSRAAADPQSEVEQLLRAAEDDLLLKLGAGGSPSSTSLDADLARRLEALKTPPPPPPLSAGAPRRTAEMAAADEEWGRILGDDLASRFSALKGSSSGGAGGPDLGPESKILHEELDEGDEDEDDDGVSKREVDKVLRWAMDAARLDPSKSDGEAEGGDSGSGEDEDDDEEEGLEVKKKVEEGKNNTKGKSKRWFLF